MLIVSLNLVILRTAMVYGPYVDGGSESLFCTLYQLVTYVPILDIIRLIAVAATYGYLHKPMKGL